jgi:hypothetical protein
LTAVPITFFAQMALVCPDGVVIGFLLVLGLT